MKDRKRRWRLLITAWMTLTISATDVPSSLSSTKRGSTQQFTPFSKPTLISAVPTITASIAIVNTTSVVTISRAISSAVEVTTLSSTPSATVFNVRATTTSSNTMFTSSSIVTDTLTITQSSRSITIPVNSTTGISSITLNSSISNAPTATPATTPPLIQTTMSMAISTTTPTTISSVVPASIQSAVPTTVTSGELTAITTPISVVEPSSPAITSPTTTTQGTTTPATAVTSAETTTTTTPTTIYTTTTTTATTTKTPLPPLPPRPKKTHVILMVADDLGFNDVSWNNPNVMTPHLGDLATGGVILNQSYVLPTCTPTRAALLTGRHPFTYGMQHGALDALDPSGLPIKFRILPQPLKKAGYTTHAIGKWHLGFCNWQYTPTERGFNTFYGFYSGSQDHYTHRRGEGMDKSRYEEKKDKPWSPALDLRNNTSPDDTKSGVYSTYLFASATEEVLRSRNPKVPMFMYLAFQSPHTPHQVPKNYTDAYKHVTGKRRRTHLAMVLALDEVVGRVVAALKATGHYENSVIIFTTDNGGDINKGSSNWPLRGAKNYLLEGGTRGPAFIHSPHLPNPGTVSNQLFHVTDWFSTIVSLAKGEIPRIVDGFDQWYALAGLRDTPRETIIYNLDTSYDKFRGAVRVNNMKLLVGRVGSLKETSNVPIRSLRSKFSNTNQTEVIPTDISNGLDRKNEEKIKNIKKPRRKRSNKVPDGKLKKAKKQSRLTMNMLFKTNKMTNERDIRIASFKGEQRMENKSESKNRTRDQKIKYIDKKHVGSSYKIKEIESPKIELRKKKDFGRMWKNISEIKDYNDYEIERRKWKNLKRMKEKNILSEAKCQRNKPTHIRWKKLKNHKDLNWNLAVVKHLDRYLPDTAKIRLFNVTADPTESNEITLENLTTVQSMLYYVSYELYRLVPSKTEMLSDRGQPKHFDNIWSPGWCRAK